MKKQHVKLSKPSKLTTEQLEKRRLEAGLLLKEGRLSQSEIARRFGVSRMAVSYWARRYRSDSLKRPEYVPAGRPSKLTPAQKRQLKQRLKKSALAAGFPTPRWTLKRVAALLKREFGVRYHPNYLPRVLRELGFGHYAANNTTGDGRRPDWPDDKILEMARESCEMIVAAQVEEPGMKPDRITESLQDDLFHIVVQD